MSNGESSNRIKPGRRMISQEAALFAAGYHEEEASYRAEQTIMSANSTINDTMDLQERAWKKQGVPDDEIFRRQEAKTLQKHTDHRTALDAGMDGANDFKELLMRPQYAVRRHFHDEEDEENHHPPKGQKNNVFAIPALPKHMGTPKVNGKAGFGCSTPIGGDVSMRSLRNIDISHVINVDQLDANKTTTHSKNVVIDMVATSANSTLQKTHTIRKDSEEESLQKTFVKQSDQSLQGTFVVAPATSDSTLQKTHTIRRDSETSTALQGTHVVEKDSTALQGIFVVEDKEPAAIQDTFVVEKEPQKEPGYSESSSALQETFVKHSGQLEQFEQPNDATISHETTQGGRRVKKVDLKERENRMADLTTSIMGSMMDTPSPGAHHFKNPRKKLRETVATPPRLTTARMSIESDKERSIHMESINNDSTRGRESVGSSYVDPVSVNASRMEIVVEEEEREEEKTHVPMDIATTPKSTRNTPRPWSRATAGESARAGRPSNYADPISQEDTTNLVTPVRNFQKPTISSLSKNRRASARMILETMSANRSTMKQSDDNTETSRKTSDAPVARKVQESPETADKVPDRQVSQNDSLGDVANHFRHISFTDPPPAPQEDVDFGDYGQEESDPEEGTSGLPPAFQRDSQKDAESHRTKPSRKGRLGLLSDSLTSTNTPGVDRRKNQVNDTAVDDWDSEEEEEEPTRRGKKAKQVGLQLAKRRIIEPEAAPDGLRRSGRTRVKPVRNWLGEQPIYEHSPSGGRRLKGVTTVFVSDKRMCKYRTADVTLATEREVESKRKRAKRRAEERRRQLELDQSRGHRMDESQDDIHTSDED